MRLRFALPVLLALAVLAAPAGAASAVPGLAPCALGDVPASLRTVLPDAIAAAQKRYVARVPAADRARAGDVFAAGVAAYVFGMPTVLMRLTVQRYPVNQITAIGELATPESRTVVAPNHDTLYAVSQLNLAAGPLVIDAPATGGRYSVLQLLDAYSNAFAYIGSGSDRDSASTVVVVPPGWQGDLPPGVRVVQSPTKLVWLLGRTVVVGEDDTPAARALLSSYTLTPLSAWLAGGRRQPLVLDKFPANQQRVVLPRGLAFFDALTAALAADPPPAADACAMAAFAGAGIAAGETPSTGADPIVTGALDAAATAGERIVGLAVDTERRDGQNHHNGWSVLAGDTGNFGSDYAHRAVTARIGLGANVPNEAIYPNTDTDHDRRPLNGRHRYVVSFGAGDLPPVRAFWSLTAYDSNILLAPNAIDRWAIGDRTPGLRYGRGRSLKLYVQHAAPPRAQRSNWLPVPAGRFSLYLRLYEPKPAAINGRWPAPTVARVG